MNVAVDWLMVAAAKIPAVCRVTLLPRDVLKRATALATSLRESQLTRIPVQTREPRGSRILPPERVCIQRAM